MNRLRQKMMALIFFLMMAGPAFAGFKFEIDENSKGEIGFWTQLWFQYVEDGKNGIEDLNDFMIRRAYLYLKGQVTEHIGFFTHIASDRVGQDGLDRPSLGLGSGVAWRDLWITFKLSDAFMIQPGRMYVPLTRNFGTTSTKAMLTGDLPFFQGGVKGGIFYAQKVGRDDGVMIWGNPLDGLFQYRLMVSEGVEDGSNPEDNLRFAGRISLNLLEPETGFYNQGTYLGRKKVLALGVGMDRQDDLTLGGRENQNNSIWTVDAFFDHPMGDGAITMEAAYIDINQCTQTHNFSELAAGDDARLWYVNAGYLFPGTIGPGRLQPYFRYETGDIDQKDETAFITGGFNYYLNGHHAKITLDYTHADHDSDTRDNQNLITLQFTVGF